MVSNDLSDLPGLDSFPLWREVAATIVLDYQVDREGATVADLMAKYEPRVRNFGRIFSAEAERYLRESLDRSDSFIYRKSA